MNAIFRCQFCGLSSQQNDLGIIDSPSGLPPSILAPLLRSYVPPTPHEKVLVRLHLSHIQKSLSTLDLTIEKLRQARAELEEERVKHVGLLSPLRSLPPELLSQIFLRCTELWWEIVQEWESASSSELRAWGKAERQLIQRPREISDFKLRPMRVLSQVCRSWRATALDLPAMWAFIYLPGLGTEGEIEASQKFVSEQLARASTYPLHILTTPPASLAPSLHDDYGSLLNQLVFPAHRRWMSIQLTMTNDIPIPLPVAPSQTSAFPTLVSLSMNLLDFDLNFPWVLSAEDAPLLKEADIVGGEESFQLPWAQLRKLRLSGYRRPWAFSVLHQLRDIEELELCEQETHWGEYLLPPQEYVTLPYLRFLKVLGNQSREPSAVVGIIPYLRLPALRTLYWTQIKERDWPRLAEMLDQSRSGCQALRELYLISPRPDMHDPLSLFGDTPLAKLIEFTRVELEVISIEYPGPSSCDLSYVVALLIKSLRSGFVPNLRTFRLQGVFLEAWYIQELLPYLEATDISIEFSKCILDHMELYDEDGHIFDTIHSLRYHQPPGGCLKLEIEGPNSKHIVYTPQSGLSIELR